MKENLTPDGVSAKIAAVYAMNNTDRTAEAVKVETSFATWISDNFNLDTAQAAYLSGLSSAAASNFGYNCGIAFRNMLQIALIVPTPRTPPTKWLKMTNNILMATDDNGAYEATGSLTFAYEYR